MKAVNMTMHPRDGADYKRKRLTMILNDRKSSCYAKKLMDEEGKIVVGTDWK